MKSHETVDDWFGALPPHQQELFVALRDLIADVAPRLTPGMKWGNACWSAGSLPLVFVHAEEDHLQLGFFAGAMLDDPQGLLRGRGKYVRHVRVETMADIVEDEIASLIVRAVEAPPYR